MVYYYALTFPAELLAVELLLLKGRKKRPYFNLRFLLFLAVYFGGALWFNARFAIGLIPHIRPLGIFLRYLFLGSLNACGLALCYTCSAYQICMVLLCGWTAQHTAYSIQKILQMYLNRLWSVPNQYYLLHELAFDLLVFAAVYLVLNRLLLQKLRNMREDVELGSVLFLSAGTMIHVLLLDTSTVGFTTYQRLLFRLLSVFACVLVLSVLVKIMENNGLKRDIEMIEKLARMKGEYYESLKENIARTNQKCHDFKHQIHQIRAGLRPQELQETLGELEESIDAYDAMVKTGNGALDIVLTEKNLICEQRQICLKFMVEGQCLHFIRTQDIYTLFGNLLDNAIEAAGRLPDAGQRVISLMVKQKGELVSIRLSNYFAGGLEIKDGLPQTTKEDVFDHGYGMKSIRYIAEQYRGDMFISAEDHIFVTSIVLMAQGG